MMAQKHLEWTGANYLRHYISSARPNKELHPGPNEQNLWILGEGVSDKDKNEICQTHTSTLRPRINQKVQRPLSGTAHLV
jgi:hypothetical protein